MPNISTTHALINAIFSAEFAFINFALLAYARYTPFTALSSAGPGHVAAIALNKTIALILNFGSPLEKHINVVLVTRFVSLSNGFKNATDAANRLKTKDVIDASVNCPSKCRVFPMYDFCL